MNQEGKKCWNQTKEKKIDDMNSKCHTTCLLLKPCNQWHVFIPRIWKESGKHFFFVSLFRISYAKTEIKLTPLIIIIGFQPKCYTKIGLHDLKTNRKYKNQQLNRSTEMDDKRKKKTK